MKRSALNIGEIVERMLSGAMSEQEMLSEFSAMAKHEIAGKELADAARILRAHALPVQLSGAPIDTCGTGGSGKNRINTSTIASFVIAAAGGRVAKHGNRAAAGRCGSFDLLEALGARIDLSPAQAEETYNACGLVFLFAPLYHPALKPIAVARKLYGKPTIFNLLGPLCNPAGVRRHLLGTHTRKNMQLLADALRELGDDGSLVVCGSDGLDELTVCGHTAILDVAKNSEQEFDPTSIGLHEFGSQAIEGDDTETNAAIARRILSGQGTPAQRDIVLLNAAFALTLTPVASTVKDGLLAAEHALDSGAAHALLNRYVQFTRTLS